jgi:ATP synthase F1 delta subunit
MSKNIEKAKHHRLEDDVHLIMQHKQYKASIAYAKGLFHFATQLDLLDPISQSFDTFISMWQILPIMRRFIQCHAIDRYTKKDRIRYLFGDRIHKVFLYFIEKLMDNDHTDLLTRIYHIFCQMKDDLKKEQKIRVISAFPMNRIQLMRLQETMENLLKLKVIIKNEIAPEILGGFICYTNSIRIDMSLKKDLNKLKAKILSVSFLGDKKCEIDLSESKQKELETYEKQLEKREVVLSWK